MLIDNGQIRKKFNNSRIPVNAINNEIWPLEIINEEEEEAINRLVDNSDDEEIILTKYNIEITGMTVKRLIPNQSGTGSWLNSDIINLFMHILWETETNFAHVDSFLVQSIVESNELTYDYRTFKRLVKI